jgi:hypothetical protein
MKSKPAGKAANKSKVILFEIARTTLRLTASWSASIPILAASAEALLAAAV